MCQAITRVNGGSLLIEFHGIKFHKISNETQYFSSRKTHLDMSVPLYGGVPVTQQKATMNDSVFLLI